MAYIAKIPRRLQVAHITQGLDVDGLEKLLVEFALHADRDRFDQRFISLTTRGALGDDIAAAGWPVTALDTPSGFRPGLIHDLALLLRRWRIDVIHTHDDRPCIHGAPAAWLAGVRRIIHTRHGQSPRLTRRQTLLVRLAARLTDRFVCVSEDAARLTIQNGVPPSRVSTIWNGIDLERFAYTGPCPERPVVTVARLSPEKGVEGLLHATALAVRECPTLRVEIAGDGPCMPDLRRVTETLCLSNQVRFLGPVHDVAGLLARASLFVLPSLSEGISLTLLEAMACGLPVVATRVGGNIEVVAEGSTGFLVPARDPSALAAAMVRLHSDEQMARAMGQAGQRRAAECFDVRRMVAAYESLYGGQESVELSTAAWTPSLAAVP